MFKLSDIKPGFHFKIKELALSDLNVLIGYRPYLNTENYIRANGGLTCRAIDKARHVDGSWGRGVYSILAQIIGLPGVPEYRKERWVVITENMIEYVVDDSGVIVYQEQEVIFEESKDLSAFIESFTLSN